MPYETANLQVPHRVVLEERGSLAVSGVEEVERFDEAEIVMATVRGTGLHIEKLSLDGGELKVEGNVDSLTYEDEGNGERTSFFARLFG